MKKNFVVATSTQQDYDALMQWAEKEGYGWRYNSDNATSHPEYGADKNYPNICFNVKDGLTRAADRVVNAKDYGPIVPFSTFAVIQGIELGPAPVAISLTKDYHASIDYQEETVTVGCQTIPFSKVKEVYQLTQQHVEQTEAKSRPMLTDDEAGRLMNEYVRMPFTYGICYKKMREAGYQLIKN